jgi:hypothetical protein
MLPDAAEPDGDLTSALIFSILMQNGKHVWASLPDYDLK